MIEPKFSISLLFEICVIARNESKTLPRLMASLKPFTDAGGIVNLLDTGSHDGTPELARSLGCNVKEVGEKFLIPVKNHMEINQKFVVEGEKKIVKEGDKYFDFSGARNECAAMAKQNVIFWYDADEVSVVMDIHAINKSIEEGNTQWEYFFCFAHDSFGNEAVKFVQCKAYDKRVMRWDGRVHELVVNIDNNNPGKRAFLDESIYKLAHYQNHESGRHSYEIGLAVDCFEFPKNDRHKFYLCRELLYNGKPKSALRGFKEHIRMNGWAAERAESHIFCGDIYGNLGIPDQQVMEYNKAFYLDSGRNKALVSLALFYRHNKNFQAAICYAKAALEIPYNGFYADNLSFYRELPEDILYTCYGFIGNVEEAQKHLLKALHYVPYHPQYLADTKYYFPYHDHAEIQGWMRFPELLWLFEQAKSGKYKNMYECGSWKGKSTHALLSGLKDVEGATLTCIDTWEGSVDPRDDTNWMAKKEDVFATFKKNTSGFNNLKTIRKSSVEAAKDVPNKSIDWCFIDMGHTKEDVLSDLKAWYPKLKKDGIICGHDFTEGTWQGVVEAVREFFGREPDYVVDSIWVFDLSKMEYSQTWDWGITNDSRLRLSTIPKRIYTVWLGGEMPPLIKKCIDSQIRMCEDFGYGHYLITLENCFKGSKYIQEALNSPHPDGVKYCKASDYLRMYYLLNEGGIYLDADCEILDGKNFNAMLNDQMFVGLETEDYLRGQVVLGTAVVGAVPNHPMIKWWLNEVETRFRGDTADNYESSMEILNKGGVNFQDKIRLYSPSYFYPYEWLHTGKTNITENTISIHHFCRTWTPEKNKNSMIKQLQHKIENGINFSFVKRGDGELACMNDEPGGNCDGHPYSKELGEKLRQAYEYLEGKATIVEFENQDEYNILLHRTDSNLKEVSEFYKAIAASPRKKVFIGPGKVHDMAAILKAQVVGIPTLNAFESYNNIYERIPIVEDAIYIICAGMPAKVLIADLMKENPNATYLDCGSAFDPIHSNSRTFQITKEEFLSLYETKSWESEQQEQAKKDFIEAGVNVVMAGNPTINNFNLPQATHPERLWAVSNIGDTTGKVIYDLGSGSHKTLPEVIGMDIRPVTDKQGSIDELPFLENNSVDVIISKHSFEHLLDPIKTLKEWVRVLKQGGRMVIVLPDHGAIDTMDNIYSAGQHLHAYTRESFIHLLSLCPDLCVIKYETVLDKWSFGVVVYKLPTVSVLVPQLGREEGLKTCLQSINNLSYPKHLLETIVIEGEETVPQKMVTGLEKSKGQVICFLANDTEAAPMSLITAIVESEVFGKGLVAFNTGEILPDRGNENEHFIIHKSLVEKLENKQIFSTDFWHVSCDNFLMAQAEKLGEYFRSTNAVVTHNHFSKGSPMDEIYERGWSKVEEDRKTLAEKLAKLNAE